MRGGNGLTAATMPNSTSFPPALNPARWRTCWREVLYTITMVFCVHAVVRQQVLTPVCQSLAVGTACTWVAGQA